MSRTMRLILFAGFLALIVSTWIGVAGHADIGYQIRGSQVSSLVGSTGQQDQPYHLGGLAGQPILGQSEVEGSYSVVSGYSSLAISEIFSDTSRIFLPIVRK